METTKQEKLIQFIHSLTDEECKLIVSLLGLGDAGCTAPKEVWVFDDPVPYAQQTVSQPFVYEKAPPSTSR